MQLCRLIPQSERQNHETFPLYLSTCLGRLRKVFCVPNTGRIVELLGHFSKEQVKKTSTCRFDGIFFRKKKKKKKKVLRILFEKEQCDSLIDK